MRRRRGLTLLLGLLAFAGLCVGPMWSSSHGQWLSGWSGRAGIQDHLADEAQQVLTDLDINGFEIEVDGRDLSVRTSEALPAAVQNELRNIDGIRTADFVALSGAPASAPRDDEPGDDAAADTGADSGDDAAADAGGDTANAADAGRSDLTVTFDGTNLTLAGQLDTADGYDAVVRSAQRLVGDPNVTDTVEIVDGDGSSFDRVSTVAAIVRRLGEWYERAELELDGDRLSVSGEATSGEGLANAERVINLLAQRAGLTATIDGVVVDGATDADDAEPTPEPTPEPTAAAVDDADATDEPGADAAVVAGLDASAITFEPGTAFLTTAGAAAVDAIGAQLDGVVTPVEIVGHTTGDGDPDVLFLLSEDRARTVLERLTAQGVTTPLSSVGVGAAEPIADNSTDEGSSANERIEFVAAEGNN